MTDALPTGEEEPEELEAVAPGLDDLGLDLSEEDQAEVAKMVEHLREQFGEDPPAEVVDDEVPDPVVEEGEVQRDEEVAPAVAETPRNVVAIDGVNVPVEEAVAYLTKREVQREAAAAKPEPAVQEAPKPPEWLDIEDPAQVAMWQRQVDLERQIGQIAQNQQQVAQQQAVARATTDANSGISTFRALHPELSEEDITTLRTHAVSLDIIDGLAKTRNGPDAVLKALDIAYWDHPEFRARATAEPTPTEVKKAKAEERKGKLNALGGSSGSAPRQETRAAPSTDREAKAAAAEWLREQGILS